MIVKTGCGTNEEIHSTSSDFETVVQRRLVLSGGRLVAAGGDRQLREPVRGARLPRGLHQGHPLPRLGAGQPQLTHQVTITIRNTHCKCCLLLFVILL